MREKWSAGVLHRVVGGRRPRILLLSVALSIALLGCVDRPAEQPPEESKPVFWSVHVRVIEPAEKTDRNIPSTRLAMPRVNGSVLWQEIVTVHADGLRSPRLPKVGTSIVAKLAKTGAPRVSLSSFETTVPPKPQKGSLAWLGLDEQGRAELEGIVLDVRKSGDGLRVLVEQLASEDELIEARRVQVTLDPDTKVRLFARQEERLDDLLRKYPRWQRLAEAEPRVRADVRVREDGLHATRLEVLEY